KIAVTSASLSETRPLGRVPTSDAIVEQARNLRAPSLTVGFLSTKEKASGDAASLIEISFESGLEPVQVFRRSDKRLDHLGGDEVSVGRRQFPQPEIVTGVVCVAVTI